MAQINISPLVVSKINKLTTALIEKEYFSYLDNAIEYTNALYDFIYSISDHTRHATKNKKYGAYYCRYKPNKHTAWYITFNVKDEVYNIENVFNNHQRSYPSFIKS